MYTSINHNAYPQYSYYRSEEFNPHTGQMEERFFAFPLLAGFGLGALTVGAFGGGWYGPRRRRRWGRPYYYPYYGYPYYY